MHLYLIDMLAVMCIEPKSSGLVPIFLPFFIHRYLKLRTVFLNFVLASISNSVLHERLFSYTKISIIIEKEE